MAVDYTNLEQCKTLVSQLTSITEVIKLTLIEQNLIDSAGTNDSTTYHRPYFVAARQLQRNRNDQSLKAADGAQFTNLETMIRSLLEEQQALDMVLELDVPKTYSAQFAIDKLCGCQNPDEMELPAMVINVV